MADPLMKLGTLLAPPRPAPIPPDQLPLFQWSLSPEARAQIEQIEAHARWSLAMAMSGKLGLLD